jgi:hypothetical protein
MALYQAEHAFLLMPVLVELAPNWGAGGAVVGDDLQSCSVALNDTMTRISLVTVCASGI